MADTWNSFNTANPPGLTAGPVTFKAGGGDEINAYVVRPDGDGPFPGIVWIHHMPGWDELTQEFARRLANHGYNVIAPNYYFRYGHGTPDDVTATVRADGGVADDSVVADSEAAMNWLKALPTRNGKVGITGTCSGGRHAVLTASRVKGFDAVVDLWGGGVVMPADALNAKRPVAPIDLTKDLDAPILGLFGNDDQSPTPDQVNQHEEALKAAGKNYDFHRYDGAGHAFFYHDRGAYRWEAAMDGWAKMFAFFEKYLKN